MIDRLVDPRFGEFHLQHRRRGRQAVAHDRGGHADRAEIIGMAVRRVMAILTTICADDDGHQHAVGRLPAGGVNVTEGQRQVNDNCDQRKP